MTSAIKRERRLAWLLPIAAATLLAMGTGQARAMAVTLCAEPYTITLPGEPNPVPMWGYRVAADAPACAVSVVRSSAAAPVITMPAGDSTLSVTLVNRLAVPTSVVIAGQALPADGGPAVMAEDLIGPSCDPTTMAMPARMACRVRSFTGETDAGATRTYTFTNLRPGSFLLQSGTHPQAQVQMGLVALLKQDAAPLDLTARRLYGAAATDVNASFDVDATALLAEVDVAQHNRIQSTLGTTGQQAQWKTGGSTLDYAPRHFLINGRPFDGSNVAANDIGVSAPNGARVVLRLANAGLQSRSLMLSNGTWRLLTEDGHPYAAPREQATVLLPAGKTSDVAMLAANGGAVGSTASMGAVFDRRGGAAGGQMARLMVTNAASVNHPPVVTVTGGSATSVAPGTTLNIAGTVSDDGLPTPPGAVTAAWSLSGPAGGATLPAAPSTAGAPFPVTFALAGRYVVQLLASDGELSTAGEAVVNVRPPQADVAISNSTTSVVTGNVATYSVVVSNAGPDAASAAAVAMSFSATSPALANLAWSCGGAVGGASCGAAAGTGLLASTANLPVGGSVTYTVTGTVPLNATGTIQSTATVSVPLPATDPNPANNSATDTDAVVVAPPALTPLDAFDRAVATNLGGNWTQPSLLGVAAIGIAVNRATTLLAAGNAYWNVPSAGFGARQGAAMTVSSVTVAGQALLLKASGGTAPNLTTYLRVRLTASSVVVERTTNGAAVNPTFTSLGTFAASFANGDTLTAVANADGSVDVWRTAAGGGSVYLGRSAASPSTGTGRIGIRLPAAAQADNFAGGTL